MDKALLAAVVIALRATRRAGDFHLRVALRRATRLQKKRECFKFFVSFVGFVVNFEGRASFQLAFAVAGNLESCATL